MTEEEIPIDIDTPSDPAALMREDLTPYDGPASSPQPIRLGLHFQDREVRLDVTPRAQITEEHDGGVRYVHLPENVDATELRSWIENRMDLIVKIFDGYSEETGELDDDALVAFDRLQALCSDEWLHPSHAVREEYTGNEDSIIATDDVDVPVHDYTWAEAGVWLYSNWLNLEDARVMSRYLSEDAPEEELKEEIAPEFVDTARGEGFVVDEDAMFDVLTKTIHEDEGDYYREGQNY